MTKTEVARWHNFLELKFILRLISHNEVSRWQLIKKKYGT